MSLIIKGKNIEVTQPLRDYAEEKIGKIKKYYEHIIKSEIEFTVERNPSISKNQTVEVTLFTKGPIFRAKESTNDMYASIDIVMEKLERQVEKYKGKTYHNKIANGQGVSEAFVAEAPVTPDTGKIVKTKQFAIKPMPAEEAVMQMNLLGHDFFVFTNSDTEEVNVVYRRQDGNYGLIEPLAR